MPAQNSPDRIRIIFDDHRLVANAGLLLPATLARHLGLGELVDSHLDLGSAPGRANTGDKVMTLVASALTGGDVLKDYEGLRAQFNNVLDLLLPGDGNDLLPLHGQDWPALKDQVTGWMAEGLHGAGVRAPPAADHRVRRREGGRRGRAPAGRLLVGHGHPGRDPPG